MTIDALRGHQWRNDPNIRKWVYVIVAKALETAEAPPIGDATDHEVPDDDED